MSLSTTTARMPQTRYETVVYAGGLDQLSPSLARKPGGCVDAENFQCALTGGYEWAAGYERMSGVPAPSSATYTVVPVVELFARPAIGNFTPPLIGATTGTVGQVQAIGDGYLVAVVASGPGYAVGEVLTADGVVVGIVDSRIVSVSSRDAALYLALAADAYRSGIQPPLGSGPVLGVVSAVLTGSEEVYCVRNNTGGTAALLWRRSVSGWSQIDLKREIAFTAGGATAPAEGGTLSRGGNTSVVRRVVVQSGSWASNTAAGYLVIDAPTPASFTAGAATIGSTNLTLSGAETSITLPPGGRYEWVVTNFYGQFSSMRIYGCNGVGTAFEFDGTTLTPIRTGVPTVNDKPTFIIEHNLHLMLGIGSSVVHSSPGLPFDYQASNGAGEIAVGDTITGFAIRPAAQDGGALAIFSRNSTRMLYGKSKASWNLVRLSTTTGAIPYTVQNLDHTYACDDQGVQSIEAVQEYGNFRYATLTFPVQRWIDQNRSQIIGSTVNRNRSQYRLFCSTGAALYVSIVNGKHIGSMPQRFAHGMTCFWSGEDSLGNEVTYAGGADGYVYRLDAGSSFDGSEISGRLTLNWAFMRQPRVQRQFRRVSLEVQGTSYVEIIYGASLAYGLQESSQPSPRTYSVPFWGGIEWDVFGWDDFQWDGTILSPVEVELDGYAENVQTTITASGVHLFPFTIASETFHYTPRRGLR